VEYKDASPSDEQHQVHPSRWSPQVHGGPNDPREQAQVAKGWNNWKIIGEIDFLSKKTKNKQESTMATWNPNLIFFGYIVIAGILCFICERATNRVPQP
jgi:hypothetical protein